MELIQIAASQTTARFYRTVTTSVNTCVYFHISSKDNTSPRLLIDTSLQGEDIQAGSFDAGDRYAYLLTTDGAKVTNEQLWKLTGGAWVISRNVVISDNSPSAILSFELSKGVSIDELRFESGTSVTTPPRLPSDPAPESKLIDWSHSDEQIVVNGSTLPASHGSAVSVPDGITQAGFEDWINYTIEQTDNKIVVDNRAYRRQF